MKRTAPLDHPGQRTSLPDFLKCDGEWIIEGHAFLYTEKNQSVSGLAPRFTVGAARHDSAPCIGFDVSQLAAAFGVPIAGIYRANRDRALICRGTAATTPKHGSTTATTYAFQIGTKKAFLTVERNDHEGAA